MDDYKKGIIFALLAAVISGFSIIANKIFIVDMEPIAFTAVRAFIIGIIFFVISSYYWKFDFEKFRRISWKYLIAIALIGGAIAFYLFFTGLKLTTGGRAAFIHKTLPIFVVVLSFIFLKEKLNRKETYAFIVMIVGTLVLFIAQIGPDVLWANPTLGDLLILGAAFFWAVETVIAKKVMTREGSNFVVSFARMFFGALFLFAGIIILGKLDSIVNLSLSQWINILISTAILFGYVFCWFYSLKYLKASKASSYLLIAPVISLILGVAVLSEPAPLWQLIGSALILMGAYFMSSKEKYVQAI